jgi:hypothetical protein
LLQAVVVEAVADNSPAVYLILAILALLALH